MSDELRKKLAGLPPRPATTDSTRIVIKFYCTVQNCLKRSKFDIIKSYRMNLGGGSRRRKNFNPIEWDEHWSGTLNLPQ